jgi:hypothetical protein
MAPESALVPDTALTSAAFAMDPSREDVGHKTPDVLNPSVDHKCGASIEVHAVLSNHQAFSSQPRWQTARRGSFRTPREGRFATADGTTTS